VVLSHLFSAVWGDDNWLGLSPLCCGVNLFRSICEPWPTLTRKGFHLQGEGLSVLPSACVRVYPQFL
jgi:hypothetical protein